VPFVYLKGPSTSIIVTNSNTHPISEFRRNFENAIDATKNVLFEPYENNDWELLDLSVKPITQIVTATPKTNENTVTPTIWYKRTVFVAIIWPLVVIGIVALIGLLYNIIF
jgi:hypothetical protein